ncbi:hypothetical protein CFP56_012891 [Quercus suber]|uniref:Uncharacterized protein n=1 Tax=Quercus suber TaxID=58331 RepID=A0AAW0KWW0_QUESU
MPIKDSNPKSHNQVSKSLATTKTERREIRAHCCNRATLPPTNHHIQIGLNPFTTIATHAATTTTSMSRRFNWLSSPSPFFCATMILVLPSVTKPQFNRSPSFKCHELTH